MLKAPTVQRVLNGKNAWVTRIRFGSGKRRRFTILGCRTEEQALARAAAMAQLGAELIAAGKGDHVQQVLEKAGTAENSEKFVVVRNLVRRICSGAYDGAERAPAPKVPADTTVREFGNLWTDGDLHQRWPDHVEAKRSVMDDRWRLDKYVYPEIGHIKLAELTLEDADAVMARVPRKLSASSRRHVAQLLVRLCSLAVFPARLRKASPIPRGWLPKVKGKKRFPILLPTEDSALLADTRTPVVRRVFYGFLHREGVRRNDAATLKWRQLDLEHETVRIEQDKTDHPRMWRLNAGVAEALRRWKELQRRPDPNGLVFVDAAGKAPDMDHLAAQLRRDLQDAGVTRAELFESQGNWGRLNVHTLRHSFVSRSLARGVTEDWIRQRTGHVSNELQRYREVARSVAELNIGDLAPLHEAVPELAGVGQKVGQDPGQLEKRNPSEPPPSGEKLTDYAVVHEEGLEPPHLAVPEPKSGASANSATRAMRRREV